MKEIFTQLFSLFDPKINHYSFFRDKKGWLEYLEKDTDIPFTPETLRDVLFKMLGKEENKPRGGKLFCLRKKYNFTANVDKTPARPEEALERFIVMSNCNDFFGQVPIGGGKESIDIGIKEVGNKFTFIELKPWESGDSPSYAILESLKNLVLYRIILRDKDKYPQYKNVREFREVDLAILAPEAYYQAYSLGSRELMLFGERVKKVRKLLKELSFAFETSISLMALQLEGKTFLEHCERVFNRGTWKTIGKRNLPVIELSKSDIVPELKRERWHLVVASD